MHIVYFFAVYKTWAQNIGIEKLKLGGAGVWECVFGGEGGGGVR